MKYLYLVWKNMMRKKVRAIFTLFSIIVAFTLYGMLTSLADVFSGEYRFSDEDRLFVTSKYGGTLPVSYAARISTIEGIVPERIVYGSGLGGYYQDPQEMFSVQPRSPDSTVLSLQAGTRYIYDNEQLESWARRRDGILIQQRVADEYDLEVGDNFPITTPGFTKADGTNTWEFVVMGIYDYSNPDEDPREAIFHYEYFDEARTENKGTVGYIVNVIESPELAERISREIDEMFANSAYETQTGTEDSLTRDYFRRVGNMGFAIYLILGAVFLTMVLVTANTMIQAFKERVHEIGVLKTLGFTGSTVLGLILAEALLSLIIGGALGLAIAYYIIEYAKRTITDMFYFGPEDFVVGALIILAVGLFVGAAPALQAKRLTIIEALGRS
jgi:putative ABC transport system permease protein